MDRWVVGVDADQGVVVQGGLNDERQPVAEVAAAATATLAAARATYPGAVVVVLGPMSPTPPASRALLAIDQALRQATQAAGDTYVDALGQDWITPNNAPQLIDQESKHPNDAGYAYVAQRFLSAVGAS